MVQSLGRMLLGDRDKIRSVVISLVLGGVLLWALSDKILQIKFEFPVEGLFFWIVVAFLTIVAAIIGYYQKGILFAWLANFVFYFIYKYPQAKSDAIVSKYPSLEVLPFALVFSLILGTIGYFIGYISFRV